MKMEYAGHVEDPVPNKIYNIIIYNQQMLSSAFFFCFKNNMIFKSQVNCRYHRTSLFIFTDRLLLWILFVIYVSCLACCLVCSLQPCGHLLG